MNENAMLSVSQNESGLIYQAVSLQKFFNFFEELNQDSDQFAQTLRIAFMSMIQQHPEKAEEAMKAYASLTDMLRMSIEYGDTLIEQSNKYYELEKTMSEKESLLFASRKALVNPLN